MHAAMKFAQIVPGTDWDGIGPVPAMGGTPERISAVHELFRLLQACYTLHPHQQLPASAWIATKAEMVLTKLRPAASDEEPEPQNDLPRLTVNLACKTITLDGEKHEVSSDQALRWVKVLADHPGEWISSTDLSRYDGELINCRTDHLRKHLTAALQSLIDSDRGKGSRLRLGITTT